MSSRTECSVGSLKTDTLHCLSLNASGLFRDMRVYITPKRLYSKAKKQVIAEIFVAVWGMLATKNKRNWN